MNTKLSASGFPKENTHGISIVELIDKYDLTKEQIQLFNHLSCIYRLEVESVLHFVDKGCSVMDLPSKTIINLLAINSVGKISIAIESSGIIQLKKKERK